MEKNTMRIVLGVVLALAVFTIFGTVVSLLFETILIDDVIKTSLGANIITTIKYIKHSSIGLLCVGTAMLASYFFTYFTARKKIFAPISAGLSLMVIAMCLAFLFDLRGIVLNFSSFATSYEIATAFFSKLISLMVPTVITCAYFTITTVNAFKRKNATPTTTAQSENKPHEEPTSKSEEESIDEEI